MENLTKKDLEKFRLQLLKDLRALFSSKQSDRKWIKSYEVKKLLNISSNTLTRFRERYKLTHRRIGQCFYYVRQEIDNLRTQDGK